MVAAVASQRIAKVRRDYNAWVANETLEDYALRFTPRAFRKWSVLRVANTAIGSVSFLALEAIGGAMTLDYGFHTALAAILAVGLVIFLTGVPISYYAARYGVDMDLLTRGAGFGYLGSTATSLIYASFTFLFFALEAAIMALALQLYLGVPLGVGYVISALAVIPLVTYGVTLISQLQVATQPVWITLLVLPYVCVWYREPEALVHFTTFAGRYGDGHTVDLLGFGSASTLAFSLIAQIGEQVDFLRFLPERNPDNRRQWWLAVLGAGAGWILPGMAKLIGGAFLAFLALQHEIDIRRAIEPTQMYLVAYGYVFGEPRWTALATVLFVIVSQIKINVTNAYAGSLAWSNFFARLTHSHPGRVVWLVFNVLIALVLMEMGVFDALEHVLGFYSNVAIAWIGAVVADLVINKPLGLSPPHIEFKRAHLYDVNPVGFCALIGAAVLGSTAYAGLLGPTAKAFSSYLTLGSAFVIAPLVARLTRGRYYLARRPPESWDPTATHTCVICDNSFEGEDMAHCPAYAGPICSLCCTLDVRCHDRCKEASGIADQISGGLRWLLPPRLAHRVHSRLGQYMVIVLLASLIHALWMYAIYYQEALRIEALDPSMHHELQVIVVRLYAVLTLATMVGSWWLVLARQSRNLALEESSRQTQLLMQEIAAHQQTDAELERARQAAEAANEAKSRFVTGMSHELRTPLNSIIGYAQLLRKDRALPPKRQDAIAIIQRSGEHLLSLIDGLLDIARIEAGRLRLEREELRLSELLSQIASMFRLQAQDRGLSLEVEVSGRLPGVVHADTKRLRQVLINLLGNAVKFTQSGGVRLRVSYLREMAYFEVIDTGPGIPAADLERIFLPFERGSTFPGGGESGTGLGLTITKLLTEVMGGQIRVRSELGSGSCFSVSVYLPTVDRPTHASRTEQDIVGYAGRPRVLLIVDDQETQRKLLRSLLEPLGFEIREADCGPAAVAQFATPWRSAADRIDAVLLDVAMPGMNGWEAARLIRASEADRTPILMVSANAFDNSPAKLAEAGCDDFIVKPTLESELLAKLREHLALTWIYRSDGAAATPPEPARGIRVLPPADTLRSLRALAEVGYVKGIQARLDQIEAEDPGLADFCNDVRELLKGFRLRELIQLVGGSEHAA